jgi:2'-5' RNA ligase
MRLPANRLPPFPPTPSTPIRVFFAAWPDAAARDALAELARDVAARTHGRAPPVSNLHVTVAFVGDVARSRIADLVAIGAAVAPDIPAFDLTLDGVGSFRGTGIAWAGPVICPAALGLLAQRLAGALEAGGFVVERRAFQPHVTLARRCRSPKDASIAVPISFRVTRVVLDVSESAEGGVRYRELAGWTLGPRGNDDPVSRMR